MDFVEYLVELYVGNQLASRYQRTSPSLFAIQEAIELCVEYSKAEQPIKIIFVRADGQRVEYKNKAYMRFEGGE